MPINLKHAMDEITANHGQAAPVLHLAAIVGWNGKWDSRLRIDQTAKAAKLLAEAGEILKNLEADEEEERKAFAESSSTR